MYLSHQLPTAEEQLTPKIAGIPQNTAGTWVAVGA